MTTPTYDFIAEPLWQRTRASFARAIEAIGTPAAIAAISVLTRAMRRAIAGRILRLEHLVRKLLLAEAAELHRVELERAKRRVRIEHIPLRGMARHWRAPVKRPSSQREEGRVEGRTIGRAPSGACSLQRPLPLPPPPGAGDAHVLACARSIDRARPETWPVHFSFALPRNAHLVPNSRAPRILDPWGPPPPPTLEREPRVIKHEAPFRLARRLEALRRVLENPKPHAERLLRVLIREARRVPQLVQRYALAAAGTNDRDQQDYRLGIDIYGAVIGAHVAFRDSS